LGRLTPRTNSVPSAVILGRCTAMGSLRRSACEINAASCSRRCASRALTASTCVCSALASVAAFWATACDSTRVVLKRLNSSAVSARARPIV